MTVDVLVYVEDPGAANFVADLPAKLKGWGITSLVLSDGLAGQLLHSRGVACEIVPHVADAQDILLAYNPKLLLVGTSENRSSLGLGLVDSAKRLGILTVGAIDMVVNAGRRFCGESNEPLRHAPDWLLVPDTLSKEAYVELGYPERNVVVSGHPHFDHVHEVKMRLSSRNSQGLRQKLGVPSDRPLLLFIAEPFSVINPSSSTYSGEYTLIGRGSSQFRTFIVLEEILDAVSCIEPKPYIVVRLHPKNKLEEFEQYKDEVDALSYGQDPLEVVWAADLVVGMSSMLLAESILLSKPTLAVLPRALEKSWIPGAVVEHIPIASNRKDLRDILADWLGKLKRQERIQLIAELDNWHGDSLTQVVSFIQRKLSIVEGEKLILRPFTKDCITDEYLSWLNDKALMKYSRQKHLTHTAESCLEYLASFAGTNNLFLSVRKKDDNSQIGTMTAYVDELNGTADVGIMIGQPGQGYGRQAWGLALGHLFEVLELKKVTAGCLVVNTAMTRLAQHWGMYLEERLEGKEVFEDKPTDILRFSILASEWKGNYSRSRLRDSR